MNEILLFPTSGQVQLRHDAGWFPAVQRRTFDCPGDRSPQRFAPDSTTGFADGHQRFARPATHTALLQLCHQQTVRQQYEVKMPGLALATAQLTIAETKMLLAVSMQGFRPRPALPVSAQHTSHFPMRLIRDQNFAGLRAVLAGPQHHDAHGVRIVRQPDFLGEIPLHAPVGRNLFACRGGNLRRQFVSAHFDTAKPHLAIALQIAYLGIAKQ